MDHTTAEQVAEVLRRQYPGLEVIERETYGERQAVEIRFDRFRHGFAFPAGEAVEEAALLVTKWLIKQTKVGDAARAVLKGWKKLQEEAPPRMQRPVDPPPGSVVRGRPLTEGQLKTLPVGTPIVVTWPGCDRSGYPYLLAFDDEGGPCAAGVRGPGGGTLYVKRLNALRDGPPWTVVWVP